MSALWSRVQFWMPTEAENYDLIEVSERFADLLAAIRLAAGSGAGDQYRLIVDRIRDALDRGEAGIAEQSVFFLANSFALDGPARIGRHSLVYRARHRDLGSYHAIKTIPEDNRDDPVGRDLLLREGRIGMAITHARVVPVQIVLRMPDGRPALVTPWFDKSIADFLEERKPTPIPIRAILSGVLSGLSAIHAAGYVHGDISPRNLMINDGDPATLRIADLGVALETGQSHPDLDLMYAGNPEFAAPEQKAGHVLDARSDLFAVGRMAAVLIELQPAPRADLKGLTAFAEALSSEIPADRPATAEMAMAMLVSSRD